MSFTHLQVRSGYSFYNSAVQISPLIKRAKELQFTALALTDEEVLHGAIPFYQACLKAQIKPILGLSLKVEHDGSEIESIVLAKDEIGYEQLIAISTTLQIHNKRAFEDLLKIEKGHLITIIAERTEAVSRALNSEDREFMQQLITQYEQAFLHEDIYIGITNVNNSNERILQQIEEFADEKIVKFVALHDVRYVNEKDSLSYDCLQAMKEGRKWQSKQVKKEHAGLHLCSEEEMKQLFQLAPSLLEMTHEITEKCNVNLTFHKPLLPQFPTEPGKTARDMLKEQCFEQIEIKYESLEKSVIDRLEHELNVIDRLDFNDYFLIVADFVQFAKRNQIVVGPGRGSAAGSLVAYLLGITDIDPIEHNLLFERFLNPERITMPDIDIDFSDRRRDEIITYVREKYGKDFVAQIITFGTFGARSILRELMKTMDVAESDQKYILNHIPLQSSQSLVHIVKEEKELASYIKQSKKLTTLFAVAIKLEGLPRHRSIHAAGIVIGKRPLINDVPLLHGTQDTYVTQYAMDDLEAIGLLKMDILGLRNLTLIEQIVQSIQRKENKQFSLQSIPLNDQKSFALLQRGKTNGIFQFESEGMKHVLKRLIPTSQTDLIALNALYRPGPMEHIPTYIKRKHGEEKVTYLHEDLKPILEETYGVLVYQEQIMQIAHRFANFSLGEADILRRAISKKNAATMDELKDKFISGCLQNNYPKHVAEQLFHWIVQFANYGFNKSHSVAYSKIAYQLAYLKANYPHHFFTQLLSSVINDTGSKRMMYIREASEFGIRLLPPSVNNSYAYYTTERNDIRIGFMAIKGIGYETVKTIIEARKDGRFTDLYDFVLRVSIKRNAIETLILAGAFDELYPNRASLLATITPALERKELFGKQLAGSLFDESEQMNMSYVEMEDFSIMQKLSDEKELLQLYVSTHPLKEHRDLLTLRKFLPIAKIKSLRIHSKVTLVAFLQRLKKIHTKRGESMAFLTLSDETDEIDAVLFPSIFRQVSPAIDEDSLVQIAGKVSERNGNIQLIIDHLQPFSLEKLSQEKSRFIYVRIKKEQKQMALSFLKQTAKQFPGASRVIVYDEVDKKTYRLSDQYVLSSSNECLETLKKHFGTENVVFQ